MSHKTANAIYSLYARRRLPKVQAGNKEVVNVVVIVVVVVAGVDTLNCGGLWPQRAVVAFRSRIASLRPLKCCGLWPQQTVATSGALHKLFYDIPQLAFYRIHAATDVACTRIFNHFQLGKSVFLASYGRLSLFNAHKGPFVYFGGL